MEQRPESSVMFNLGELMRLEDERVEAECERQRSAERAQVESALHARERERLAREDAVRAERERAARQTAAHQERLLRLRLEHEGRARAEAQEAERRHTQALRRIDVDARDGRRLRLLAAVFAAAMCGVVGGYQWLVRPAWNAAIGRADSLEVALAAQRARTDALESELRQTQAQARVAVAREATREPAAAPSGSPRATSEAAKPVTAVTPRQAHRRHSGARAKQGAAPLRAQREQELLLDEGDDPLSGLLDDGKRQRRSGSR